MRIMSHFFPASITYNNCGFLNYLDITDLVIPDFFSFDKSDTSFIKMYLA